MLPVGLLVARETPCLAAPGKSRKNLNKRGALGRAPRGELSLTSVRLDHANWLYGTVMPSGTPEVVQPPPR